MNWIRRKRGSQLEGKGGVLIGSQEVLSLEDGREKGIVFM